MNDRRPCGPLAVERPFIQYFRLGDADLLGIRFTVATYMRPVRRRLDISLYKLSAKLDDADLSHDTLTIFDECQPIASATRVDWADNDVFTLEVDPAQSERECRYALCISADPEPKGTAITLWLDQGSHRIDGHISSWAGTEHQGDFGLSGSVITAQPVADSVLPRAILYSPVTQCNLNCIHCISRETREKKAILSADIKNRIRQWCRDGLIDRIGTDYSGDILWADKKFGGEIDFLKSLNVPFHIDTNGVHLDRQTSERIVRSKLEAINISLDASTTETFQRVRKGAPPLEDVIANIAEFMEVRNMEGAHHIEVSMSFTLMAGSLQELPEFIRLAHRLGVKLVHARHLEAYTADMGPQSLIFDREKSNQAIDAAIALGATLGVVVLTAHLPAAFGKTGHTKCHVAWGSAVIMGNGDVAVCCVPRTTIGNLYEADMEDIWNGPHYREFRRRVNSPSPPPQCNSCPMMREWHNVHSFLPFLTMEEWKHPKDWILPVHG